MIASNRRPDCFLAPDKTASGMWEPEAPSSLSGFGRNAPIFRPKSAGGILHVFYALRLSGSFTISAPLVNSAKPTSPTRANHACSHGIDSIVLLAQAGSGTAAQQTA